MLNKILNKDYLDLLKNISDNSVNLVATDPPFGINYSNNYTTKQYDVLDGDNNKFSYYELAKESFRILKDNSAFYCFSCWSEYPEHYKQIEAAGFQMKEPIICQKRPSGKTDLYGSFQSNSDWIIFATKGKFKFKETKLVKNKRAGTVPNKGRKPVPEFKTRFPSCWFGDNFPWSSENSSFQTQYKLFHPTIKTAQFMEWLILLSTDEDDIVVDPFCGSGATPVACVRTNRNYIAGDVCKNFCECAEKRINLNV